MIKPNVFRVLKHLTNSSDYVYPLQTVSLTSQETFMLYNRMWQKNIYLISLMTNPFLKSLVANEENPMQSVSKAFHTVMIILADLCHINAAVDSLSNLKLKHMGGVLVYDDNDVESALESAGISSSKMTVMQIRIPYEYWNPNIHTLCRKETQTTIMVTLLNAGRFEVRLPYEVWEVIFSDFKI